MAAFTNQATLSYNNIIKKSNLAEGELVEVLSASKVAVMDDYVALDDVTFIVSIRNTGTAAFTGLTLEDNLGGYTFSGGTVYPMDYVADSIHFYVNGVESTAPTPTAGPPLVLGGINVPAGGNVLIVYEASVNEYAPLGVDGTITNKAVIKGGGLTTPLEVSEVISTENVPDLSISKSVNPATVTENGSVTYTFLILNSGNTAAGVDDHVVITDEFDPLLTITEVKYDDGTDVKTWVANTDYSYTAEGVFTSVDGKITVPAAEFTQNTSGVWVTNPGTGILTITGTL